MGNFKNKHGKSRTGLFLKSLGNIADPILEVAGDLTGIEAFNKISEAIVTDKELNEYQKKEAISAISLDIQDLSSSREMGIEIQKTQFASWMAKNVPYIIDLFILLIWGAMTLFIIGKAMNLITADNIDWTPILGIYSGVTGLATQIISYHRGSSAGSKMKDLLNINKNNV